MNDGSMMEITGDSFGADVLNSPGVVLVNIGGDHCPSCHLLTPLLMEVAADLEGRVRFLKMNVGANTDMARSLGIIALPTVLIFNDGEERVRMVGLQNKARLFQAVEMAVGKT